MTAASFTAAGLPAAPVAASADGPPPPGSASGLGFAEVMVEAMAGAPAEGALALGITVETGCEAVSPFALKHPTTPRKSSSPVASDDEGATAAITLEALAQSAASQLRLPSVPVRLSEPPSVTPAQGEAGQVQQVTEVAPQPSPLATLKRPSATARAESAKSAPAAEKVALPDASHGSMREAVRLTQPGVRIESEAATITVQAPHLPADAEFSKPVPPTSGAPWPSGIATKSSDEANTSENSDGLSSSVGVIEEAPPRPLNSSVRPDAPAGPDTRVIFPAGPPGRPPDEEQPAPVRPAQHPDEAKPSASEVPAAQVKRPDQSATATSNALENQTVESPVDVERTAGLAGQGPFEFVDLIHPAGEVVARIKPGAAKVSPGEARGPEGRTERVPSSLAGELAAEAGTVTTPPAIADRENHCLPVRPVHSAAEARFAPQSPSDSSAPAAAPPPFRAGTGTAELGDGMKNATEPKQFAGLAQQNLPEPGVAFLTAAPELLRRGGTRLVLAEGDARVRPDASSQLISFFASDQPVPSAPEEAGILPATLGVKPPSPAESLQASVLKHITELRHTGATEMAVVLKPDAETQLALRLTMGSNGEVLVQARCEHGDAQALAANWGEIRQSLAQQGVRLGALEFSPERGHDTFQPHAGNGGPSPDGQPSSQRHGQPWPETLDDLPLTGSLTEPLVRRGVPRPPAGRTRLLESWA